MNQQLQVVFMGTPEFATKPLEALIIHPDFQVVTVVTQEDKKVGRRQIITPPPVKVLAEEHDIPVLQPPSVKNNPGFQTLLRELQPDFIIVVAYGQILPREILDIPTHGCVNIHASLLPRYRGASPIESAIAAGDTETGLTFMKMTEKMDAGPILHVQRKPITPQDTAITLREKLSVLAGQLLPTVLRDILDGIATPIEQEESQASYCHKISKEDGVIDLSSMTAQEIQNRVRAYTPWPSCYIFLGDKKLKIIQTEVDTTSEKALSASPGQILEQEKGIIAIGTKEGLIIPKKVQLQGKNEMDVQEFLRGNKGLLSELLTSPR